MGDRVDAALSAPYPTMDNAIHWATCLRKNATQAASRALSGFSEVSLPEHRAILLPKYTSDGEASNPNALQGLSTRAPDLIFQVLVQHRDAIPTTSTSRVAPLLQHTRAWYRPPTLAIDLNCAEHDRAHKHDQLLAWTYHRTIQHRWITIRRVFAYCLEVKTARQHLTLKVAMTGSGLIQQHVPRRIGHLHAASWMALRLREWYIGQLSTTGQRIATRLFDTTVPLRSDHSLSPCNGPPRPPQPVPNNDVQSTSSPAWNALREQYLGQVKEYVEDEFHTWTRTLLHMCLCLDIFTTAWAGVRFLR